jgi:ketosteroid isomerase-like protein
MRDSEKLLVTRFLHAMASRDASTLREVLHPDVVWHVPPSPMPEFLGPHLGIAKVLALVTGAGGSLFVEGSQAIEILSLLVEGDQAAARFRMTGRTLSGIDYDNLYVFFFRLEAGGIVEVWENLDTGYFYGIFGIEPVWVRAGTPSP